MIAGRSPFPGNYEQAVVFEILNQDSEPLTAVRTGVPMQLEWLVNKLLAKTADERYQSATGLLVDLKTIDLTASGMISGVSSVASSTIQDGPVFGEVAESTPTVVAAVITAWPVVVGAVFLTLLFGYFFFPNASSDLASGDKRVSRMDIVVTQVPEIESPIISRDGWRIVFVGRDSLGTRIYSRPLDARNRPGRPKNFQIIFLTAPPNSNDRPLSNPDPVEK